ncbi:uroporphyrin-3 C-methyltransferase [Modicisalibacter ilicicola DSM 19980]|uniref:Uroporphyrin-3 C-methyltransferase n=1 Tax=Modicisalibacter ilicicola DSM 19980 TaxID=1121942 RepID=A0A1M5AJ66_9GAMM|nr:uroporphyrinogen-III C-methyltransferase [Halomonas ilicicola]SHF30167.1 uroporphyrin-3 C-methyltransferase [Halomonas ilicicola DSM 19980]
MSKQEHDQDEQRALSGADKSKSPGDATTSSNAEGEKSTTASGEVDRTATGDGKTVTAEEQGDADKPAPGKVNPGKSSNKHHGRNGGKGRSAAKNSTTPAAAKTPSSQGPSASQAKPEAPGKPVSSSPGQASSPGGQASQGPGEPNASTDKPSSANKPAPAGGAAAATSGGGAAGAAGGGSGSGGRSGGIAGIIALVLVVLLIVAAAIGGWWLWQQFQRQQSRLDQVPQTSQVESNAGAIDDLESRLSQDGEQRQQAIQDLRDEMQQYRESVNQTLDQVLEELSSQQQPDEDEWVYAEIEYLLRLATQRLQLERDVEGAQSLLRTADQRLAGIDNPALTPVRRAVQSDLGELRSVPGVDRTGLYLTLMSVQEQLAKLPLQQDIKQIAAEGGDTSTVEGGWQQQLARFGQELKELVVVRKHDQALEALMTPEQESYLRQNARLQLEQSQLALLQANPELYRASLEKGRTLIDTYYDPESEGVQKVLEQLATLSDETIRPELPDITGSLETLRDFMARRQDGGSAEE